MTPTSSLTYEQFLEAVRILAQPTWTDTAGVLVAGLVGIGQCLLIAWGIKIMRDGNASRDANLKALETQGKALETQAKALETQGKALETQGKVLGDIGAGLQELLRRSAS